MDVERPPYKSLDRPQRGAAKNYERSRDRYLNAAEGLRDENGEVDVAKLALRVGVKQLTVWGRLVQEPGIRQIVQPARWEEREEIMRELRSTKEPAPPKMSRAAEEYYRYDAAFQVLRRTHTTVTDVDIAGPTKRDVWIVRAFLRGLPPEDPMKKVQITSNSGK